MEIISLKSNSRTELVDITKKVEELLLKSGVKEGVCFLFCPHTTAALAINENADPSVKADIESALNRLIPRSIRYAHSEGNSDAHIKSTLFGPSVNIFVEKGKLCLGTWQAVYFCEGDGPRSREIWAKFLKQD